LEVSLPLPPLFDADLTLDSLQRSSYGVPYHFASDSRSVRRLMYVHGMLALVEFVFPLDSQQVKVRLLAVEGTERESTGMLTAEQLERIAYSSFGLGDDLARCYAVLGEDPPLANLIARYHGMRLFRAPDLYEALLVAILGQQISVRAANACRLRLVERLGEHLEVAGLRYATYPRPARLLAASVEVLRAVGTGVQKARYLHAMAGAALAGRLEQAVFMGRSDEEAVALLCEIPGVGRWTAEVALLRGLGRPDAFPAGDLGLQMVAQRLLSLGSRPSERELRPVAERWRPWRGYAALYLWGYLRDSA
jgi:DNA-3-methyladenine glycosylase II